MGIGRIIISLRSEKECRANGGTDPLSNGRVDLCVNERRREILRRFFNVQLCDIELVFVGGFRGELQSENK